MRLTSISVFLATLTASAGASGQPIQTDAYATSGAAGVVYRNPFGLCWRTAQWTEPKAIAECDPELMPKPAPRPVAVPAPVVPLPVAEPAPAPKPAPAPAPAPIAQIPDTDGDGVPDNLDRCPDTKAGVRVDTAGCAIPPVVVLEGVNFATNSARLTPDSALILDAAVMALQRRGSVKTEIAGHTDDRGLSATNKVLSQRRAEAVMKYLVSRGLDAANLSAVGYGESRPVAVNATERGRASNRRVELRSVE